MQILHHLMMKEKQHCHHQHSLGSGKQEEEEEGRATFLPAATVTHLGTLVSLSQIYELCLASTPSRGKAFMANCGQKKKCLHNLDLCWNLPVNYLSIGGSICVLLLIYTIMKVLCVISQHLDFDSFLHT